ncbi:MAG: phosphomannomutase/phosphoglucomutase [Patescibacteria group bacterium]
MNDAIFKAYDIRGVYPQELDEKDAYQIGRAFASFLKAKTILVGEDGRTSSPALKKALIRGIAETGANVILAGRLTTPMFYFAVAHKKHCDGGIMVTASHNPARYNGFKLVYGDAMPIEPKAIIKSIENKSKIRSKGKIKKINIADGYIKKILSLADTKKIKPLKIVIDAGNGMAGGILPKLLKKIPQIKATPLFFKVDMSFPNHEANPLKEETLEKLKETVVKTKADLGIAYDGDADRIGFVDEKGNFIRADFIFSAILPQIFKKHPKTTILYDLRSSKIIAEEVKKMGGKSKMTRVGHAFIKKELRKSDAAAAAEISSHFYFKDFYGVECSDLTMLSLLLQMSETGKNASELIKPFEKYFQSGEINFEVSDKEKILSKLLKKYKPLAKKVSVLDGIRMDFKDAPNFWWFNVRASNTEPLLRLNAEASNKNLLEKKLSELKTILAS